MKDFFFKIYKRFMSHILCSDLMSDNGLKALVQICKNRLRNCSARLSLSSHVFQVVIPVRAQHLPVVFLVAGMCAIVAESSIAM